LTCSLNSSGDSEKSMFDFGKEVTGCASLGVADCFFTASDVALFIGSPNCRPDWVNTCILNPPAPGSGGGGGAVTPIILSATPLSPPVPGQRFILQLQILNLSTPFTGSVIVTGPGCPTMNSCVVPAGVTTLITSELLNVPLTLAPGNFTSYISQLGQLSNGEAFSVGGGGTPPGPTVGALSITFSPNPVQKSSDGAWYYTVTVTETNGSAVTLTGMNIGGNDYTSYISSWFGTNTVPAHGRISVNIKTTGSSGAMTWSFSGGGQTWSAAVNLN